ncbi:MAG: glycosyltransferase 87 family protein [Mycobacterium sp.]
MTRTGWSRLGWGLVAVAAIAFFATMTSRVMGALPYRIDVDVYRMGAQAWLDGHRLYGDVLFETGVQGKSLPFTYPPIAAVLFTPFTWVSLQTATTVLVVGSAILLVASLTMVLTRLNVLAARWHRAAVATLAVAASILFNAEPILSNFGYGQINAVLMALVIADCVPRWSDGEPRDRRRLRWPRGLLVGLAISIKLTPAVFLLYFFLRGDRRALLTAVGTFAASVAVAFVVAPRDSWEYWTRSLLHTQRIGDADLNTNQNLAGFLARIGITGPLHFLLWAAVCFAALALTVGAVRRLLASGEGADEPVLALICVALFGLLVSPVSWSHHWVWALPTIAVCAVIGYRRRNAYLLVAAAVGMYVIWWAPLRDIRTDSGPWVEVLGASYVWWGLAVIAIADLTATAGAATARETAAHESPEAVKP